jgi:hypothetical protein
MRIEPPTRPDEPGGVRSVPTPSRNGTGHHPRPLGFETSSEFFASAKEPDYLIDRVMVRAEPFVVGGPEKVLKTGIAEDMAYSLASGTDFLGKFAVRRPGRVAFMSSESGRDAIQKRGRAIAKAKGINPVHPNILWSGQVPDLPRDSSRLIDFAKSEGIDACFVDPAYLAMASVGDQASNLYSMGGVLRSLKGFADNGCAVVIVHHTNSRLKTGVWPRLQDLSHAGMSQWMRSWALVNRDRPYVEGSYRHELLMSLGGSAGHSDRHRLEVLERDGGEDAWKVRFAEPTSSAGSSGTGNTDKREVILDALLRAGASGETKDRLKKPARMDASQADDLLGRLESEGLIEKCMVRRGNNQKYPGYRLTRSHSETPGGHVSE